MYSTIPSTMMEKFTTFGDLLRFLRRRAGITQMELATLVGYSDAQISRLEQNLRLPDIPTVEARIIPALGLQDDPKVVAHLLELAANVRREDAPALGLCPYKGLNFFDESDADLFAGREALTTKLTERLLGLVTRNPPAPLRFLAVVGASGSGKSSLVRAGLVPALRWDKDSTDWNILVFTPTAHPLESLALSLTQENGSISAAAKFMDDLAGDPRSLHLFARREMKSLHCSSLLLVVDQFEELFALCRSEEERVAFINNLLTAASEADGPVIVVITLRADFYAHCAGYLDLREALALQQEYIGAMSTDELRRAIEEPARRGRWEFEPGLVELLLRDVGHEPGALPLLSHALLETWQRRRGRLMTLSGYTSSGGVRGAIAETAETVFTDQFTPEEKTIARRIFLRLTELSDETATGDTRRRATLNELILNPDQKELTHHVLKALADARLIITSENSAEVAHEALIREWPTLRSWLEDNRENLRLHRHLTEAAQEWALRNHEADVLYRGARLAQACEWASSHPEDLNPLEREFLQASQQMVEKEAHEREAQRQRELEAAHKLAEIEHQRAEEQAHAATQLRKRSIFLAGAFVLAIVLALAAGLMGWQARSANRLAISRELAAASINNLEIDPERSALLALEALSASYTNEAEDALHLSIMASRVQLAFPAHEPGTHIRVAFSPDGTRLVTASPDEVVKVWDSSQGTLLLTLNGHSAEYSPDGKQIASVISDGTVKLWDASTGEPLSRAGQINAGATVDFSPDGSRLATVTSGNLPRLWDIETGKEAISFPGHTDYVSSAFFSPDGNRLLTASDDGTARVWDTVSGEELLNLSGHPGWVWTAAFSPDGSRIVTLSEDLAIVWDARSGVQLFTLPGQKSALYAVAFSPDNTRLATGGLDRKVKLWDAETGKELFTLPGHTAAVTGLAFSPDSSRLASSSEDGSLRIWDLTPGREWLTLNFPDGLGLQSIFNPAGTRLAGIAGKTVKVWDIATGTEMLSLSGFSDMINTIAYDPQGKYLVTSADGAVVKFWDALSGKEIVNWSAHTGRINSLALSPDGASLATASNDYKVKIWDISKLGDSGNAQPPLLYTLDHNSEVKSVAFSPDGKTLAAGLNNGMIKTWLLPSGGESKTLDGHSDSVIGIAFSPDGELFATASLDGTARVWSGSTSQELFALNGHTGAVMSITFSPDRSRIATASRDGTAKIWDAENGQELLTFIGDGTGLFSVAFSPDGTRLATSGDAGIKVYLLDIKELVSLARTRLTRRLSTSECQEYLHRITPACAPSSPNPTPTPWPLAEKGRICQVTSQGGLSDNYFNELIYTGLQDTASLLGWQATALQSVSFSSFEENLRSFLQANCRLIVSLGTQLETTQSIAQANPEQNFMLMDFVPDPPMKNIWSQVYATDQAAFLAGYVAASATKTGKVGVFGGIDIPQVTEFMDGFALGVDYYNQQNGSDVEVIGWDAQKHAGLFVGSFCCTTEGRQMARQLLDAGADIIMPVAGQTVGWGAGAEIQENGDAWLIGVDTDWSVTTPEFANIVLTSVEKRFDTSVVEAARAIAEGTFTGGIHSGTLETGEVSIAPFHALEDQISPQVKSDLQKLMAGIINGSIQTKP